MNTSFFIHSLMRTLSLFQPTLWVLIAGLLPGGLLAGVPGSVLRAPMTGAANPGLRGGVASPALAPLPKVNGVGRERATSTVPPVWRAGDGGGIVVGTVTEEGKLRAMATAERPHLVLQVRQEDGWSPVASRHLRGEGKAEVVFELPEWTKGRTHRVMAFADAGYPAGFTGGERTFGSRYGDFGYYPICGLPVMRVMPMMDIAVTGGNMTFAGSATTTVQSAGVAPMLMANAAVSSTTSTRSAAAISLEAPVEADIWKIVGTRLFFFNQYRGLQVLDLSNPAAPVKTGALRMSAVGEQLYVLNDRGSLLALVTDVPGVNGMGATEIVMVEVSRSGVPKELSRFRMSGGHEDSRLMGNQLHLVLTQSALGAGQSALVSVDFSKPKALVVRSNQTVPGWMPKLQAAGGHLLVATTGSANYGWVSSGDASTLHVFRVLKAGGTELVKALPLKGVVLDKFKMSLAGGALVAVTQSREASSWMLQTWVATYPLAGLEVAPMAQVSIPAANWETLYATRFDGTKVYVVTFRRIDPLFVVELEDPANPVITGELEVPGWSTYLLPRGDQLVAVGVEGGHATVSLFGVADPALPTLLSRVSLGANEGSGWSSTEANYDEKAVEFLPEAGLLLLPFQKSGYAAGTGRYWTERGIQVVRVGRNALTLGEVIPHDFDARRGSLIRGHFVSISGRELVVVKQGAGKAPPVAQVSLAWQVDEVLPFGEFLMQIEYGSPDAMLRVTTAGNPDGLVEEIDPGPGVIAGVERRGGELHVAQKISRMEAMEGGSEREVFGLRTWRFDLSNPPLVKEIGRVESWEFGDGAVLGGAYGRPKVRAVWPRGDLLVWEVRESGWFGYYPMMGSIQPINTIGILPINTIQLEPVGAIRAAVMMPIVDALFLPEADSLPPKVPMARGRVLAMLWPVQMAGREMRSMAPVRVLGGDGDRLSGDLVAQNGFVFLGMDVRMSPWVADTQGVDAEPVAVEPPVKANPESVTLSRLSMGYWYYMPPKVWSAMMVVDFTQTPAVVREPVGVPGGLVAVANVGPAGGVVVAFDAITRDVRTLVYDGVACWNYADAVLQGSAGLLAGEAGMVCRALGGEAAVEGKAGSLARLEAYRYGVEQRGFIQGDVWNVEGGMPQGLRIRGGQVFLNSQRDGFWATQLAGLGGGARLENRRTVMIPAGDYTLNLEAAVMDRLGAGLWVPRGLYGVAYFGTELVVMPPAMVEPAMPVLSAPVMGVPRVGVMGVRTIGPLR
jgi:hypothetical protein